MINVPLSGLLYLALKLVVERIKGRLYVYLQGRENGKVVTKYLGPLDRIVEGWLNYGQQLSDERLNGGGGPAGI